MKTYSVRKVPNFQIEKREKKGGPGAVNAKHRSKKLNLFKDSYITLKGFIMGCYNIIILLYK